MGFSGAVQWWDDWHLRILVLGSLFIQYFLFFSSLVRRRALPAWFRLFIWLAYLGGDALAIYSLATLFNRHRQPPGDGSGSGLEVVWAPVLLIHLGGQHTMTAYSIQDNELWVRHAITVASQITVALYVFCMSWSGEKKLLQAAILMFVVGIIRSCQKPWALQSASISAMVAYLSPSALRRQESVKVSQHSLLSCGYRAKRPTVLMKLATLVSCKDYVNMHCYIEEAPPGCSALILQFVHGYVRGGWKEYIHNAASFRNFNGRKGHWTLKKRSLPHLRWSLNMAFDRSVLLWHITTDLLCYDYTTAGNIPECATGSAVISRYMAYLLCIHPEMLMPGTRNSIFNVACHNVELILGDKSPLGNLVHNAVRLQKELLELQDEGERWEVVQGVWVEMLCYSACKCRGYLHAQKMSDGVELLSRVWLLLSNMGMETFADRFQKPWHVMIRKEAPDDDKEEEGHEDGAGRDVDNEINISVV
ncbi:hypothetical protein VPH35_080680 [Triticum aestivum]